MVQLMLLLLLLLLLLVTARDERQLFREQLGGRSILGRGHTEHQIGGLLLLLLLLVLLLLALLSHHVAHLLLDWTRQDVLYAEGQLVEVMVIADGLRHLSGAC